MGDKRGILFISLGAGMELLDDVLLGDLRGYDLASAHIAGMSRFDMCAEK